MLNVNEREVAAIEPGVLGDAECRAENGGADFGDEFLGEIGLVAKAAGRVAIAAVFWQSPMDQLIQLDAGMSLGARHAVSTGEEAVVGHLDMIGRRRIESALAALDDFGSGRGGIGFGSGNFG